LRTEFDLKRAEERAHILTGLAKALGVIDRIIATIKKSRDRDEAHTRLVKQFSLSEVQATAILEMRLQTLAALEQEKIESELKEKLALIKELSLLLKSPAKVLKLIKDETLRLKERFSDKRRTTVVPTGLTEFREEDLVPEEEVIVTLSASGYIKRLPPDAFRKQRRGGKGLIGSEVAEDDFITHFLNVHTHDNLLFFTDRGRVFQTKAYDIPAASRTSKGRAIQNFLELPTNERVSALVNYRSADGEAARSFLVMATRQGLIKKTPLKEFENIRRSGIIAIALKKDDLLKWVRLSEGKDQIILVTRGGQAIRFKEIQVRPMGRAAAGVRAIRLRRGDGLAGFDVIREKEKEGARVLAVMANGFAKQTPLVEYKVQQRGGSGIRTAKVTQKTGEVVAAQIIHEEAEIFALSHKGQLIRTELKTIRTAGRATQGVKIMHLKQGDTLAGVVLT
jgi:DNA gyrase subunit A